MNELIVRYNERWDWPLFYDFPRGNDTNKSSKNVSPNRHKARREKARASRKARRKAR